MLYLIAVATYSFCTLVFHGNLFLNHPDHFSGKKMLGWWCMHVVIITWTLINFFLE